jgi:hypothetical protein
MVMKERDGSFIFFEFKVGSVAQSCTREGLGPLPEYLNFSREHRVKKLVIVPLSHHVVSSSFSDKSSTCPSGT